MAAPGGTYRTPTRSGRGQMPNFDNSASHIPRPKLDSHTSVVQSDAGGSTLSASRQKQSKRDEVNRSLMVISPILTPANEPINI